jgi:hypothetical protein
MEKKIIVLEHKFLLFTIYTSMKFRIDIKYFFILAPEQIRIKYEKNGQ